MAKKDSFMDLFEDRFKDLSSSYIVLDKKDEVREVVPTGSLSLDASLGVGGIPQGRITEISGVFSSGKTSLTLAIAKKAIAKGLRVLFIDVENQLDYDYARALVGDGLTEETFVLIQTDTAEDAFETAEIGIKSKEFGLIVFDSIGALAPEKEKKDEFTDANVALVPRLLSKFLRRNAFAIRDNNIAFIFINQVRDTIGSYVHMLSTPGGHALKHFASIMITLSKGMDIKQGDEKIGITLNFVIKKNKLAPPFRGSTIPLMYGKGIDELRDVVLFCEKIGVLTKAGPYYKLEGESLGQGVVKTMEYLENHPETLDKLRTLCYNNISKYKIEQKEEEDENT